MYVTLKAQCNMLNIGDERIMHNSLMTTSCHVYFVGHLLQKKIFGMSSSKLQLVPFWQRTVTDGKSSGPTWFVCSMVISTHAIGLYCYCYALLHMNIIKSTLHSHSTLLHFMHLQEAMHCEHCLEGSQLYMINHALLLEFMPLEQQWL